MPVFTLKDCQNSWEKYRIRLNNDYNKHLRNIRVMLELNNMLISEHISNQTLNILSIADSMILKDDLLLLGHINKEEVNINGAHKYIKNKENLLIPLLGECLGVCFVAQDCKITGDIILKALQWKRYYKISSTYFVILLKDTINNNLNIEAYLLNNKICELYADGVLYSNKDNTDKLYSKKEIEIYQEGGVIATNEVDIQLFYVPISISK